MKWSKSKKINVVLDLAKTSSEKWKEYVSYVEVCVLDNQYFIRLASNVLFIKFTSSLLKRKWKIKPNKLIKRGNLPEEFISYSEIGDVFESKEWYVFVFFFCFETDLFSSRLLTILHQSTSSDWKSDVFICLCFYNIIYLGVYCSICQYGNNNSHYFRDRTA